MPRDTLTADLFGTTAATPPAPIEAPAPVMPPMPPARPTVRETSDRGDVYQRITDRIVAQLEAGIRPWHRPWDSDETSAVVRSGIVYPLRVTGERYRGINVLLLWCAADAAGYRNPMWMTFRQAQEFGGCVRKGEKGTEIVYANRIIKTELDDEGNEDTRAIPFLKGYTVFNVEQIDGLPAKYYDFAKPLAVPKPTPVTGPEPMPAIDEWVSRLGADLRHGGDRAYYAGGAHRDWVQMPHLRQFHTADGYYSVLLHELTHWTSDSRRCDRQLGRKFGDEAYAAEELIAELGAAFLCADLDVTPEMRQDHVDYIGSWIRVLKDDKRAIFTAASKAQAAADWLHAKADPQPVAMAAE